MFYFSSGDKIDPVADKFSNKVRILLQDHSPGNKRLAVDKIMLHGVRAIKAQGLTILHGEEVTAKSRAIKGPDEILPMRCANHACERAVHNMEDFARGYVPNGHT